MNTFVHTKSGEMVNLDKVKVIDDPYRDGNLIVRMDDGEAYAVRFDTISDALQTIVPAGPDDKAIIVNFFDGSAGEATIELHKIVAWRIPSNGWFPKPIFATTDDAFVEDATVGLLRPDMKITLLNEVDNFDTVDAFIESARDRERRVEEFNANRKAEKEAKAKGGAA